VEVAMRDVQQKVTNLLGMLYQLSNNTLRDQI